MRMNVLIMENLFYDRRFSKVRRISPPGYWSMLTKPDLRLERQHAKPVDPAYR